MQWIQWSSGMTKCKHIKTFRCFKLQYICMTIQVNPGVSESWYSIMVRCLRSYWKFLGNGSTWFQSLPGLFIKLFIEQDKGGTRSCLGVGRQLCKAVTPTNRLALNLLGGIRLHWTTMRCPCRILWMKEHCIKFENKSGKEYIQAGQTAKANNSNAWESFAPLTFAPQTVEPRNTCHFQSSLGWNFRL